MPEAIPSSTHGGGGLVVLELVKVEVLNEVALALGRNRELAGKGGGPLSLCNVSTPFLIVSECECERAGEKMQLND